MSRLSRIPYVLFLVCSQVVLVGCQHPLAPSVSELRPAVMNNALRSAGAAEYVSETNQFQASIGEAEVWDLDSVLTEYAEPSDESPVVIEGPKEPEHPIVQMGNDLVELLKIFSGR